MTTGNSSSIRSETRSERTRLVRVLEELTQEQWNSPSLCDGWRIREVVAHIVMPFEMTRPAIVWGIVRSGMSFHRYADRAAHEMARAMSTADLVDRLRSNVENPWTPPGGGKIGALSDDVIHGLDITESLALSGPPPDRIALVLNGTTARQLRYFGVDLSGHRLVANDADVSVGEGPSERVLGAKEILLIATGRKALLPSGPI